MPILKLHSTHTLGLYRSFQFDSISAFIQLTVGSCTKESMFHWDTACDLKIPFMPFTYLSIGFSLTETGNSFHLLEYSFACSLSIPF